MHVRLKPGSCSTSDGWTRPTVPSPICKPPRRVTHAALTCEPSWQAARNDPDAMRKALTDAVGLIDPAPKKVVSRYGQLLLIGGLSHYGLGNMEKAADYLVVYVKQNPKHVGPTKILASIYVDRGDATRAIALLEPLQSSAQNDPQFLSLLAAAYIVDRRPNLATPLLERAVKVSGGTPDLRADFGVNLIASGQSELGFDQLQQALAKDPGQARSGVILTMWYLKRGQPKKALEVIDSVVRRDPKNVDAVNLQGVVRMAAGDKSGSRAAYEKALSLNPRYQPALLNLARLDIADGKPEAARARLTEMLKVNKNNGEAMFEMALLEERAGRTAEAIEWLEKARQIPKHRVDVGNYLTDLLVRQRDFERALKVAKDVVSREPKNFSALRALARTEIAAGDIRGAKQTLGVMGPLASFDPGQNVEIARLQFAAGDRENAVYSLDKILRGDADYLPALALLAEAEIGSGDYAKAEQHARRIAERYPTQGIGPRLSGDLAVARGQFPAAITFYRAALAKEKSVDTALRLYRAQMLAGDTAKGLAFLEQWSRDNPDDLAALRVLADEQLRTGNLAAARGRVRAVVAAQSRQCRRAEQPSPGRDTPRRQGGVGLCGARLQAGEERNRHHGHPRLGAGPTRTAGSRNRTPARCPAAGLVQPRNSVPPCRRAGESRSRGRSTSGVERGPQRRGLRSTKSTTRENWRLRSVAEGNRDLRAPVPVRGPATGI